MLCLHSRILVVRGAIGMISSRSYWKLPLCLTEPTPSGSKKLTKTKPISDGGSSSGIMYLRREENCCRTAIAEERSESM